MNPMMNSPLFSIVAAVRSGKDPMALLRQMAGRDPRINQAMKIMQGKNPQQLQQIAQNMAKERGMTVEDIARSLGVTVPSNR